MIRAGLSHLLKTEPTQLHFIRGEKGKPLLIDNKSTVGTKVGFNVSHQVSQILPTSYYLPSSHLL